MKTQVSKAITASVRPGVRLLPLLLFAATVGVSEAAQAQLDVAVQNSGSSAGAVSSDLGVTWTSTTMPSTAQWRFVTWSGVNFVALAQGPSTAAAYSPDGINWTATTMPASSQWDAVACDFTGNCWAIQSGSDNTAMTTNNGVSWSAGGTLPSSQTWGALAYDYGTGNLVALVTAGSTSIAATSSNGGSTWTARTMPSSAVWQGLTASGELDDTGYLCAVASGSSKSAYSTNGGVSWTASTLPSSATWNTVVYNNFFIAVAGGPSTKGAYSTDCSSWTTLTMPASVAWRSISVDRAVIAQGTTQAAYASGNPSFSSATMPSSHNWESVASSCNTNTATPQCAYPAPTITSFSPTSGPAGTPVTITGTNFYGMSVMFNTTNQTSVSNVSSTTLTTTVPAGATSGPITAYNNGQFGGGSVTSASSFTVTP